MRIRSGWSALRLGFVALLAAVLPSALHAQRVEMDTLRVYHVSIPESAVRSPTEAPQACLVDRGDPTRLPIDTTVVRNGKDSVWVQVVRVEGETRTRVRPPADLDVYAGAKRRTMVTTMDSVVLTDSPGKMRGARITVQEPNTGRVFCSVTLAGTPTAETRPPGVPPRPAQAVVSIGASFDLLDGVRANDLYTDARVFAPGLWIPRVVGRHWPVGIQTGVYQGRATSTGDGPGDTDTRTVTRVAPVVPLDTTGGLLVRSTTYDRTEHRREDNLGLYLGLNVRLIPDLYVPLQLELRREHLEVTYRDSLVTDSVHRLPPGDSLPSSSPTARAIDVSRYLPSLMFGLRLDMRRENFNLVLQPLYGRAERLRCDRGSDGRFACDTRWDWGEWDVTFELEAAKSGYKLGGEVRGFQGDTPSILIYLAKEFTVEKFAEFVGGSK